MCIRDRRPTGTSFAGNGRPRCRTSRPPRSIRQDAPRWPAPSGGRGGEFVVQGAVLPEQHAAPLLDELGGITILRVEIRSVVVAQLAPELLTHDGRKSEGAPAPEQIAASVGRPIAQ